MDGRIYKHLAPSERGRFRSNEILWSGPSLAGRHYAIARSASHGGTPYKLKYRLISVAIHFPTGTETPFPIIR
jgi:hypothetical protein